MKFTFYSALSLHEDSGNFLRAIENLQLCVYGKSYKEDPFLPTNEGDLAEKLGEMYYGAKLVRSSSHDLLDGEKKIEVRFRRLAPDRNSSAYYATVDVRANKDADLLLYIVYNPVTKELNIFEYDMETVSNSVTVRWSQRDNCYTPQGGADNLLEFPGPIEFYRSYRDTIVGFTLPTEDEISEDRIRKLLRNPFIRKLVARYLNDEGEDLVA